MSEFDEQIDAICDQFEGAWLSSNRPSIADFVGQPNSAIRLALIENLVPLDIEYRIKLGEEVVKEDYAHLGPQAIAIAESELQRHLHRPTQPTPARHDPDHDLQPPPSDLPGNQIGPYKLIEKIGEGGMGSVWLAQQLHPVRRSVALKLGRSFPIPRNLSPIKRAEFQARLNELSNRFESERQTQAVMDHPNIAKVLDAGTTEDQRPYFVMELVDGSPINEYCDSVCATVRQRIELMIQACKAIQHAHQKGIIHRDIKPSNVLVTTQDNQAVVKVIDFGLAKVTREADHLLGAATPTQTGMIMGTYLYMSPEQAGTNSKDIDTRSDVYSLGVLLFELLTSSTPIDRARANELIDLQLLAAIREEEAPRPSDRLSTLKDTGLSISRNRQTDIRKLSSILRGDLDWIALKALAKDRKRRYDGPSQFAEDLQRYLDGEAIVARPPSVRYRLRKTLRKHRVAVGVTGMACVLIAVGFIATYSQLQRAIIAERNSAEIAIEERSQRETAETNLARATKAEAETLARVKELEELTRFQESQFLNVDIQTMAMNLRQQLLDALDRSTSPEEKGHFESSLLQLNLVDISRGFLKQNVIEPAINSVKAKYSSQPKFQASIFNAISSTSDRIGLPAVSIPLMEDAVRIRREVLGDDHPETFSAICDLSALLIKEGNLVEAESLAREAVMGSKMTLGNAHPSTLAAVTNLSVLFDEIGDFNQAELLLREALEISQEVLGNEHPTTLLRLFNLGILMSKFGKLPEAERFLREALDIGIRALGNEHPQTLMTTRELSIILASQGRWLDAEPLHRQMLDTSRKVLGDEHPDTLTAINSMASLLDRLGNWAEAESLHREALDTTRKLFGNEHPSTLRSIDSMASFFTDIRKSKEAESLYRELLNARRTKLGNENPSTLATIHDLAVCLDRRMGSWSEVGELYREGLEGRRRVLGNDHPDTLNAMSDFARSLHLRQKLDEAEKLYRECLNAPQEKFDPFRRARVQVRLGKLLLQTKNNPDEAKQLIEGGYLKLKEHAENIEPGSRQAILDEAEAALQLLEPPK